MKVFLKYKDGVVQPHHINPKNIHKSFERLVDRTEITPLCTECYKRGCVCETYSFLEY